MPPRTGQPLRAWTTWPPAGSVVLRKGTINTEITVPILSDSVEDDGESFTLILSNVSGAEIADGEAVGTIRDGESVGTIRDGEPEPASTGPLWSADMSVVDFGNGSIGAWGANKFSNVGGTGYLKAKWLWYHTGDRKPPSCLHDGDCRHHGPVAVHRRRGGGISGWGERFRPSAGPTSTSRGRMARRFRCASRRAARW